MLNFFYNGKASPKMLKSNKRKPNFDTKRPLNAQSTMVEWSECKLEGAQRGCWRVATPFLRSLLEPPAPEVGEAPPSAHLFQRNGVYESHVSKHHHKNLVAYEMQQGLTCNFEEKIGHPLRGK